MKKLAVLFGGKSVEHEVSVITGVQLMNKVDQKKYDIVPIYIDKSGKWWTGEVLREINYYKQQDLFAPKNLNPYSIFPEPGKNEIDVAILCFHGRYGEGGNVQGLLELAGIPYQGPGVTSSSLCFDKIFLRQVLSAQHVSQPAYNWFTFSDWKKEKKEVLKKLNTMKFPVFIKPANGGSTIGIQRVTEEKKLEKFIEQVLHFDTRILVEEEVRDCIEVNVSVMGTVDRCEASVPEQPIKQDDFLSFADKYERGGKKSGMASATRRIPAPISQSLINKLQGIAQQVFRLFDCSGVIRIDFFVNPSTEEYFVIEPNTIPGSMSYYLWEASGVSYSQLIDKLVNIAQERDKTSLSLTQSFDTNILKKASL